jgi:cobalt-zinc-cadmium efflux system outer membrane protein
MLPLGNPYLEVLADRGSAANGKAVGVTGTLWLPFEVAGQRGRRIDEANAWVDVQTRTQTAVAAKARAAAVHAWGRAVVGDERIRLLQEIYASAEQESAAFRTRCAAGDATERDAQLADVERARLLIELESARVAREAAGAELRRLTGLEWTLQSRERVVPPTQLDGIEPARVAAEAPSLDAMRAEARYYGQSAKRYEREALSPISLIVSAGHDDVGETRVGAGLGVTFPAFRRNQGERARAQAEQTRVSTQVAVQARDIEMRLTQIAAEWAGTRRAERLLLDTALPIARNARQATESLFTAGKLELLAVIVSRRDEALLRLRHLDLAEREWELLAAWTDLTGKLP